MTSIRTLMPRDDSSQKLFEGGAHAGLVIAILDDHRRIEAESPLPAVWMPLGVLTERDPGTTTALAGMMSGISSARAAQLH